MAQSDIWMLIAIGLLLIVLVFLAVAEMGLSRISKHRATSLADAGSKSGKSLLWLVSEPERWVNPLLLTVNICQTVQATLTGILANRLFGGAGVAIGVVLNVIVFFVLAEAVPKTYAVLYPERAAKLAARPVSALVKFPLLRWISRGLIGLTNVIVKGKGLEKGPFVNEQELLGIVETAAEEGVVEHEERELIESIIEFGDTVAREVMVPRPDMVTIEYLSTVTTALDVAIEHGYSRLPVLGDGEDDDVVGLAYTKDLMRVEREGGGARPVTDLVRPVRFIPENKLVNRLMREMQTEKFHLAIVADEYGAIAGLITLEDCLEELVGDIVDEYDEEDAEIVHLPDGGYLVDGRVAIDELDEVLETDLPDDDWDTLGGLVFNTLGHVPVEGDHIVTHGWRFTVREMEGRRIKRVEVAREVDAANGELVDADS
ncbi:MAG: hemolysin family protein [Actinobacteria bacterium]|nr:hemolysin family protein [Actinomycetota bacterium]